MRENLIEMVLIEDGPLSTDVRYSLKVVGTLRVPSTIYSKNHNYLDISEVRKPRQRECVGIVVH